MNNALKQKHLEEKAKIKSQDLHEGPIFTLRREELHFDDGSKHNWDIIAHPGAVVVIPVLDNGNLLLVKQWRRAIKTILVELPAGTLDEKESPLVCAQRELQEEVDHKAETFIPLGGIYSTPGFCDEYLMFFIAKDLTPSSLPGDIHEGIDILELSLNECLKLIDTSKIEDLKTIAGILKYERWLRA